MNDNLIDKVKSIAVNTEYKPKLENSPNYNYSFY